MSGVDEGRLRGYVARHLQPDSRGSAMFARLALDLMAAEPFPKRLPLLRQVLRFLRDCWPGDDTVDYLQARRQRRLACVQANWRPCPECVPGCRDFEDDANGVVK